MKNLIITLLSIFLCVSSYAQVVPSNVTDLSVADQSALLKKSADVLKRLCPNYPVGKPCVRSEGKFTTSDTYHEQVSKNNGRIFYTIDYPNKNNEESPLGFAARVFIWQDDKEPAGILFCNGLYLNFFFRSYQDLASAMKKNGCKISPNGDVVMGSAVKTNSQLPLLDLSTDNVVNWTDDDITSYDEGSTNRMPIINHGDASLLSLDLRFASEVAISERLHNYIISINKNSNLSVLSHK